MAGSQISTSVTIINSLLGFHGLSLTNMSDHSTAATAIAAGSKVEIASAFFTWASNDTPTSWSSIATGTNAYIALTPSGTAGSQVVSAAWVSAAAVYSNSKQGWYTSAASNVRIVAGCFKTGAASTGEKFLIRGWESQTQRTYFEIGGWDMDTTTTVYVTPGLSQSNIINAEAWIRNDVSTAKRNLEGYEFGATAGATFTKGHILIAGAPPSPALIELHRHVSGLFDGAAYDATAGTVASRGHVTVDYKIW